MEHRSPKKGFWGAALSMSHILHCCLHKDAGRLLRCPGRAVWRFHAEGLAPEAWTAAPSSQHSAVTHRQQRACSEVFAGEKRAGPAGAPLLLLELTVFPAEHGGAHPSVLSRQTSWRETGPQAPWGQGNPQH